MRAIIMALVLCVATPAAAQSDISGQWAGIGFQVDRGGPQSEWTMQVALQANGSARVTYPSLQCEAVWSPLKGGPAFSFRERITAGNCVDGGVATLIPARGRVFYFWTGEAEAPNVSASAVLYPADGIS